MEPLTEPQRGAALEVLFAALIHLRAWLSAASAREGLPPERCAELNRLLNIVHNLPKFLEGTHSPGFDEHWFLTALRSFDEQNGTNLAARYTERVGSASAQGPA